MDDHAPRLDEKEYTKRRVCGGDEMGVVDFGSDLRLPCRKERRACGLCITT